MVRAARADGPAWALPGLGGPAAERGGGRMGSGHVAAAGSSGHVRPESDVSGGERWKTTRVSGRGSEIWKGGSLNRRRGS